MSNLSQERLETLALGAALLGSGGGGNTNYSVLAVKQQLEKYGSVKVIPLSSLKDDDLIVPLAYMGAPLVGLEKIPGEHELNSILIAIEKFYGRRPTALAVAEIGGANAFTPFYIAGKVGLPVIDADLIGRAFPELQMVSTNVHKLPPSTCFLADSFGNTITLSCKKFEQVEAYARQMTVAFGSSAVVVLQVLTGAEAKRVMIPGSVSKAWALGEAILLAKYQKKKPAEAIALNNQGVFWGQGMITDIDQKIEDGFLQGKVFIKGMENFEWRIDYQNEYLFLYNTQKQVASSPDIISLLDSETGMPIPSESLDFGLYVDIVTFKSAELWYSAEGLKLVGPQVFG